MVVVPVIQQHLIWGGGVPLQLNDIGQWLIIQLYPVV
jgi:hypothetical protein